MLTDTQLKEVYEEIHRFLWTVKRARISMYTLSRTKEQGGLCLVDLKSKQKID